MKNRLCIYVCVRVRACARVRVWVCVRVRVRVRVFVYKQKQGSESVVLIGKSYNNQQLLLPQAFKNNTFYILGCFSPDVSKLHLQILKQMLFQHL